MRVAVRIIRVRDFFSEAYARQPLVFWALLFVVGIFGGYRGGWGPVGVATGFLVGALALSKGFPVLRVWLFPLIFLAAGGWVSVWDLHGRRCEVSRVNAACSRKETFECRVGPEVAVSEVKGDTVRCSFVAERFRMVGGRVVCRHLPVRVHWFGDRSAAASRRPHPGEVWRLSGRAKVRNGGGGLPELTVNTGEGRSERLAEAASCSWRTRIARARLQAVRRVAIGISDWGVVPLLNQAILLGNRSELPLSVRRVFADSGTIHVFAISGLHIVLVASVLVLVVTLLGIRRPYWVLGVTPVLIFYTIITGARPSAVRACLMAVLYFSAPLMGRRSNGLSALAGTALVVHAFRPWQVFDVGSVLSFVVMSGLVVFCRPFCAAGSRLCRIDRLEASAALLAAGGELKKAGQVRFFKTCVRFLSDAFAVSLSAWLASVPLTAYYFGRVTPGGLFANLIVGPCSFFVVVAGCLGMVASFVSEWVASCFNHAAGFLTVVMMRTAEVAAALPGGSFRVARWSPWMVAAWLCVLGLFALWIHARPTDGLGWLNGTGRAEGEGVG